MGKGALADTERYIAMFEPTAVAGEAAALNVALTKLLKAAMRR